MRRILVVLALASVPHFTAPAQTPEQKKESVAYLQSLRTADGGFAASGPVKGDSPSSLRATSAALRALKYFGGAARNRADAEKFVAACYNKGAGAFADRPGGKPDVATTAVGLMAVVELKMPLAEYEAGAVRYLAENARTFDEIRIAAAGLEVVGKRPAEADSWLKQIAAPRNKDDTYGAGAGLTRATGGAVACWLRLGGKLENAGAVVAAMMKGQRSDGGFGREEVEGSDLETSYRVLRAFVMLKAQPDADNLRGFVARCRNADGGYGVMPGQPSTVSATYFASIILHWLK